jgi:hypothetical protein
MWLEAILTKDDLRDVFEQFAPLEIRLGESGRLILESPSEVSMNPGSGVGVVCDATLHWPVLGVDLPVRMRGLTVLLHPTIQPRPDGRCGALVFTLQIDHTGVSLLPAVFDARVTSLVNRELAERHAALEWNFGKTLSHVFALPAALVSAGTLSLKVHAGSVKTTSEALGFAVGFLAEVQPRARAPAVADAALHEDAASPDR